MTTIAQYLQILAALSFIVVTGFCLDILHPRDLSFRPALSDLKSRCQQGRFTQSDIRDWVGDECHTSIQSNQSALFRVYRSTRFALMALAIESLSLALAGLTTMW